MHKNSVVEAYRVRYGNLSAMNIIKTALLFIVLILQAFSVIAEGRPLKIGVILSLTGQGSYWSNAAKEGVTLAAEEMEKEEGVKVQLIFEDSATSTSQGVKAFQKLASVDKVDAIVGDVWGYLTQPLIPLAEQMKVLTVSPGVSGGPCREYFWGASANIDNLDSVYGDFLKKFPAITQIGGMFFDDADWGNRIRAGLLKALKNESRTLVAEELSSELNPDFRAIFTRILAKNPQAIFVAHEPMVSTKTMRERSYKGMIVQSNAVFEALLRNEKNLKDLEGVYFADVNPNQEFHDKFEKRFGHKIMLEPQTSYEIIRSLVKAYKIDPKNLKEAIKKVEYNGVAGKINYRSNCSPNEFKFSMYRFEAGIPKPLNN